MTTQPHFTETDGATGNGDQYPPDSQREDLAADSRTASSQPAERDDHLAASTNGPAAVGEPPRGTAVPQSSTSDSLFGSTDLTDLRSRWDDVQAGFVDDPRKCVQTADGLVLDAVQQLTEGFSQARSNLEQQWARGEDVSTEDLRLALKRYREFFDRLLAV